MGKSLVKRGFVRFCLVVREICWCYIYHRGILYKNMHFAPFVILAKED